MNKLYPIATAATRHLFVHPSISTPWDIVGTYGYKGEESAYLKPGKVENLMELCRPADKIFTVFEEPNPDTIAIDDVLFGVKDINGHWVTCRSTSTDIKLTKLNAAQWGLEGPISVNVYDLIDTFSGGSVFLGDKKELLIPIKLRYDRATRALEWSSSSTFDDGIELIGITLDLDWKDSKKFSV